MHIISSADPDPIWRFWPGRPAETAFEDSLWGVSEDAGVFEVALYGREGRSTHRAPSSRLTRRPSRNPIGIAAVRGERGPPLRSPPAASQSYGEDGFRPHGQQAFWRAEFLIPEAYY